MNHGLVLVFIYLFIYLFVLCLHPQVDGQQLLRELYAAAPVATGVELLCISSLKDAAQFCRENEVM